MQRMEKNQKISKKSGRGGPREASGRPKRSVSPERLALKEACQELCPQALEIIVEVMIGSTNEAIRLSAAKEILDRGYGRAMQSVEHTGELAVSFLNILNEVHGRSKSDS